MQKTFYSLLISILIFINSGCATSDPKVITYQSLMSIAKTVDISMEVAGTLYKEGKITDQQKDQIIAFHKEYQKYANIAGQLAKTIQTVDNLNSNNVEAYNKAMIELNKTSKLLLDLIESFKKKVGD